MKPIYKPARGLSLVRDLLKPLRKKNGNRPCDCTSCDCGNFGDAQAVASWDAADWILNELEKALAAQDAAPSASPSVAPADSESGSAVGPAVAAPTQKQSHGPSLEELVAFLREASRLLWSVGGINAADYLHKCHQLSDQIDNALGATWGEEKS